jgi:hypothetical protein
MENIFYLSKFRQINGPIGFFNYFHKIMKFDAIGFKNEEKKMFFLAEE